MGSEMCIRDSIYILQAVNVLQLYYTSKYAASGPFHDHGLTDRVTININTWYSGVFDIDIAVYLVQRMICSPLCRSFFTTELKG